LNYLNLFDLNSTLDFLLTLYYNYDLWKTHLLYHHSWATYDPSKLFYLLTLILIISFSSHRTLAFTNKQNQQNLKFKCSWWCSRPTQPLVLSQLVLKWHQDFNLKFYKFITEPILFPLMFNFLFTIEKRRIILYNPQLISRQYI